jgi:1-aminocyclopropane-1-carboxylate deaminase/D-cysteine desulfhydrase-like pyridoxal-dependent ACC family enzyme
VGISVLKGENNLPSLINAMSGLEGINVSGDEQLDLPAIKDHSIISAYCFSGYARYDQKLVDFKKAFETRSGICIDYVYTVKLFYSVYDLCRQKKIPAGSRVLIIHSGGVQGNAGFEKRYQRKFTR